MRYVALLRGVNVGGNRKLPMADLRAFAARLGLENPTTLLQSGNLVFGARKRGTRTIEEWLEAEAEKRLAIQTTFLVRSADEWEGIVARNPFPEEAKRDPSHLVVTFLKEPARKGAVDSLNATNPGPEVIHDAGRELYITFPAGMGTSKLPVLMERAKLAPGGTSRNWNTVLKLLDAVRV